MCCALDSNERVKVMELESGESISLRFQRNLVKKNIPAHPSTLPIICISAQLVR